MWPSLHGCVNLFISNVDNCLRKTKNGTQSNHKETDSISIKDDSEVEVYE